LGLAYKNMGNLLAEQPHLWVASLVVLLIVIILPTIFFSRLAMSRQRKREIGTIKREFEFWLNTHEFQTNILDIKDIAEAIDRKTLESRKVRCDFRCNSGFLIFKYPGTFGFHSFVGSLRQVNLNKKISDDVFGDLNSVAKAGTYLFQLHSFKRYDTIFDATMVNVVLTAVEQAILSLDANAFVIQTPDVLDSRMPILR
jgi:hypothetical protein